MARIHSSRVTKSPLPFVKLVGSGLVVVAAAAALWFNSNNNNSLSYSTKTTTMKDDNNTLNGFGFEVYGRVQGVFFRKYTQQKAQELGLQGWVQNTREGTVVGEAAGMPLHLSPLKHFLQHEGSPQSRIDRVEFRDLSQWTIQQLLATKGFVVRKTPKRK